MIDSYESWKQREEQQRMRKRAALWLQPGSDARRLLKMAMEPIKQPQPYSNTGTRPAWTVTSPEMQPRFYDYGRDKHGILVSEPSTGAKPVKHFSINGTVYTTWSDGATTYQVPPQYTTKVDSVQPESQLSAGLKGLFYGADQGLRAMTNEIVNKVQEGGTNTLKATQHIVNGLGGPDITSNAQNKLDEITGYMKKDVDPNMEASGELDVAKTVGGVIGDEASKLVDASNVTGKIPGVKYMSKIPGAKTVGGKLRSVGKRMAADTSAGPGADLVGDLAWVGGSILDPGGGTRDVLIDKAPVKIKAPTARPAATTTASRSTGRRVSIPKPKINL